MAKNYLVTGGSGFIGAALVERLVAAGHNVRVLDNNSRGAARRLTNLASKIEFVNGDVRNTEITTAAARGMDCVCHLAYVNGTEFFYSHPELVLDVAVRGMLSVIDACRHHAVGDLVLASSSEVYQTPPVLPAPEDVPLIVPDISNPRYSYGGGKILCELMAMNYGRNGFDRVTIFRPHNVYGPDMGWEHVIPQFVLRAREMTADNCGVFRFPIKGDGRQTRSFVHIDDFTDGLMKVIDKGKHLSLYHIGTTDEVSIAELARQVIACFGIDAEIIPGEAPAGETSRRCPNINKLSELGYEPRISLAEGLKETVNWYIKNAHLDPRNS